MKEIGIREYVNNYYSKDCFPGEHHFVAVYLLRKFASIPDYLNPDGMKGVCGDIVFGKKTDNKFFSVEVKVGKTSFTFSKNENNSWFVNETGPFPDYLIALTRNRLFILKWRDFSELFIKLKNPKLINDSHGKSKSISENDLLTKFASDSFEINSVDEKAITARFEKLNAEINEKIAKL